MSATPDSGLYAAKAPEVWFFLPHLGGGGAEMNAVRLAQPLLDNGLLPVYVVTRDTNPFAKDLPTGAELVVLDSGRGASSTLRIVRSIGPLARLMGQRRPAILCPVMPVSALAALVAVRLSQHKPRVALSIQNTLQAPITRGRSWYERLELGLIRLLFPAADLVIALSKGVAADVAELVPRLRERVQVVYNAGLPLAAQLAVPEPDIPPRHPGRLRFIACGRLVEQKGYPYLIEALAQVVRTVDAELHILGDGPLRAQVVQLIQERGLEQRVVFLGFRRNPFAHMMAADVFVLSSLWEGFGNVIVEAMAVGTPVISTACPHGPDEIISDQVDGLLVRPADADALALAMLRLAQDPALRHQLGARGQQRAAAFSSDVVGRQFADALKSLLPVRS